MLDQIASVIGRLKTFPRLGHPGVVDGTLERIVPRSPYVIVYRIDLGDRDELDYPARLPRDAGSIERLLRLQTLQ